MTTAVVLAAMIMNILDRGRLHSGHRGRADGGYTPIHASFLLAAVAVGAFIGSGVGAWAATAVGRPILHIGLVIMAAGTLVLDLSLHAVHGPVSALDLVPGLVVFGIGMGMIFVPLFSIIMGEIDDHEVGSASGRAATCWPPSGRCWRRWC